MSNDTINLASGWAAVAEYATTDRKTIGLQERKRLYEDALVRAAERELFDLDRACSFTRSPIEEIFMIALWKRLAEGNLEVRGGDDCVYRREVSDPWLVTVLAQAPVGPYTADFVVTLSHHASAEKCSVAVELDGHEFHEKTKRQAAHDKKRDRFFAAQRLPVLRFTGSEAFKDAAACVHEVMNFLADATRGTP